MPDLTDRFPASFRARLAAAAAAAFASGPEPRAYVAPGRVNLIGEHTDYNEGFVLPCALDLALVVLIAPRSDMRAEVTSIDLDPPDVFAVTEPTRLEGEAWSNYARGVVWGLGGAGAACGGFTALFGSTIPVGAGLSSSAAIEVCLAYALNDIFRLGMDGRELALLCQRVENQFVGVNCGIMDQFVVANAQPGHALLLDCRTLATEQVPLTDPDVALVVCDTHKPRALAGSKYNERRAECEQAVAAIRSRHPHVRALRDANLDMLAEVADEIPDHVLRRARHVVTENDRVLASVACLRDGNILRFGAAMNASHESLRSDYEVSCDELDRMVAIARSVPGVLGARMTGAGFGGCTVNLVQTSAVSELETAVLEAYPASAGLPASVYRSVARGGVAEVDTRELLG